jgi:hypothetical protein
MTKLDIGNTNWPLALARTFGKPDNSSLGE